MSESFVLCKRHSPAWRLFNLRYKVMASNLVEVTTEYLADPRSTLNVTGDRLVDTLASGRMEYKNMTAAALAMNMSEGHTIAITNLNDCVQMYSDIQDHLHDHLQAAKQALHIDDLPPIEDLRAFEALALVVYRVAKKLEPRPDLKSNVFDAFVEMSRRRNLIATNKSLSAMDDRDGQLKPYVSIVDTIERYVAEII